MADYAFSRDYKDLDTIRLGYRTDADQDATEPGQVSAQLSSFVCTPIRAVSWMKRRFRRPR
ncbi:hypothetical protein KL86PLE_30280 [uncultured Pleomorphomonas sp.]|uniref:Uncharacterized protein n=1 Tax=uncultured Pleomorphomonas sp. TaxID=442121 RepID=A0A212LE53_9HYPH|nr:hypothetical protein KL86PLE_30280 [uncultured Pleomorphomonas sp.]